MFSLMTYFYLFDVNFQCQNYGSIIYGVKGQNILLTLIEDREQLLNSRGRSHGVERNC